MPNHKYIVPIDKDKKRLNQIFKELTKNRECLINSDSDEWHTPMKKFGHIVSSKNLGGDEGFLEPVYKHKVNNVTKSRLIRLRSDAEIELIQGNDKNFFRFKRRKI